jgi:UDP-N-acetylmuramoyl-tripeptide--D-alanyl-D-alanine ligase
VKAYPVKELAAAMNGTLVQDEAEWVITGGVSTDTRRIPGGAIFFALKGDRFDGHEFLDQAAESGAGALVVERAENLPPRIPVVKVDDTLLALQQLAGWYRRELGLTVVVITGSNGKTSTKDFTRSVLSQKFKVNATKGNLNNHIGLPLSVLATGEDARVGVFEVGMNHAGELAPLCEIAKPDLSIITNIGTAHIEHLGSREAIAREKGTVARALEEEGTLLVPASCDFVDEFRASTKGKVMTVGEGAVRAEKVSPEAGGSNFELVIEGLGRIPASIAVSGRHMVENALLAAGAGAVLGLSLEEIARGLKEAVLTSGRLRQYKSQGAVVIDDTYNANPESVIAALETLAGMPGEGRRIAVLGMMAELGDHASEAYPRVGGKAGELGLTLLTVGDEAEKYGAGQHFHTAEEAATWLDQEVTSGDIVLFKGSRMAAMERVMNQAFPESV